MRFIKSYKIALILAAAYVAWSFYSNAEHLTVVKDIRSGSFSGLLGSVAAYTITFLIVGSMAIACQWVVRKVQNRASRHDEVNEGADHAQK